MDLQLPGLPIKPMHDLPATADKIEIEVPVARAEMKQVTLTVPVWQCPVCQTQTLICEPRMIGALNQYGAIKSTCYRCKKIVQIVKSVIVTANRIGRPLAKAGRIQVGPTKQTIRAAEQRPQVWR